MKAASKLISQYNRLESLQLCSDPSYPGWYVQKKIITIDAGHSRQTFSFNRQENAFKGITVNAVAPGYIATEMVRAVPEEVLNSKIIPQIPVGRLGEAEEVARAVVFLAAENNGFITGSTLTINGGQYMA